MEEKKLQPLKKILSRFKRLHRLSKIAIKLGFLTMICFYITAAFAFYLAPHVNYINAMTIYKGCLEAAPAAFAACVCAGLLGDLMLPKSDQESSDGKDEG
ncbi:MAG: hypothetical protein LBV27_04335 [Oscillospiraceae bacterium]|jgi:hypothetical protein|nr:hypothetical protein [Oscillospiraceae bacterium]